MRTIVRGLDVALYEGQLEETHAHGGAARAEEALGSTAASLVTES
ncbi:hypothetical protein ERO13_D11G105350v2 [Gossypium hirsutum]|uniref:Uncharacterized protein n=1 Tax=Gossypium darwinii TaxID=34276 RepID=A0A5D2AJX8_GOSDA|nr:hypothetical protein ERO13_D11G105350v2 [Gossypium hirsutum]TYG44698.1 hypothetical protein ES288_D11G116600v1 [Gossypium darwinii]